MKQKYVYKVEIKELKGKKPKNELYFSKEENILTQLEQSYDDIRDFDKNKDIYAYTSYNNNGGYDYIIIITKILLCD